jgi:2-polyprenyl-6-methoxyphenol hydroxylase-like FAD-dependent oxidoreductase
LDAYEESLLEPAFAQHFYCEEAYTMKPLATWQHKRVILMGDAAHPMGTVMGLGTGLALEDAQVLLSSLTKHSNLFTALAEYEAKQIPRTIAFKQLEQEITDFILYANDAQYSHFIAEFKQKTPLEANGNLIKHLKASSRVEPAI